MKKKKTLRRKINLVIVLNLLVISLIYSLILFPLENKRRKDLINDINFTINSIVGKYEPELANEIFLNHQEAVELILQKILKMKGIVTISVFNTEGGLFYSTDTTFTDTLLSSKREKSTRHYSLGRETIHKKSFLTYTKSIIASGEHTGYIKVYYRFDEVLKEYHRSIIIFTTLLLTILLTVSVLLNILLSRSVIRPVGLLSDAIKKVQQGALGEQVELNPDDEIGEMAQAFNKMSSENAQMYKELESLSHSLELKVKERTKGLINANRDVVKEMGEHKKSLIALEEEKSYLDNLFNNAPEAIVMTDENHIVQRINKEFTKIFGYTCDDAVGKLVEDLIVPSELSEESGSLTKQLMDGNNINFESKRKRKDGKRIHVSVLVSPIKIGGNKVGHHGIFRDITERKKTEEEKKELEEQLQQSQKMEAIGQLAGGVAHDFNNMLAIITGYSEMIKIKFAKDNPKIEEYIGRVLDATMNSADLIGKLLAFARKGIFKVVEADVNSIIQTVIDLLEHTIDKLNKLVQQFKTNNAIVMGDVAQLQNAILNIAINAIDAMPNGGTLTFTTDIVTLDKKYIKRHTLKIVPGAYVQITIADTGTGMSEETMARVFEPFFTTKRPGKGTGLGLASVFGTIENHKGSINVKSTLGKGTTFTIHLPVKEKGPEAGDAVSETAMKGSGTILIVDDEEEIQSMLEEMLTELGYTTITCSDGKEAAEYFSKHYKEIDLVILDVMMPELNGVDCYLKLKKVDPGVKAIICSGYATDMEANKIIEKESLEFVQKPFNVNVLSKVVYKAIHCEK